MVSALSARLLAGTRNDSPLSRRLVSVNRGAQAAVAAASSSSGDQSSQGSNKSSKGSSRSSSQKANTKKRTAAGFLKQTVSSVSGYSGDKEDVSSVLPPMASIDIHGRGNAKDPSCPKRQKLQDRLFAASTAKDDLERAGMEYKPPDPKKEEVLTSDDVKIKLKNVRLIHSNNMKSPLVGSNVSQKTTVADYVALVEAVSDSYPASNLLKPFESEPSTRDNSSNSDQSTSSVSDTESDSGSDNVNNGDNSNNQLLLLPPLVESALSPEKLKKKKVLQNISPCNVISNAANATTMTESLQLSKDARYAAEKSQKYSSYAIHVRLHSSSISFP